MIRCDRCKRELFTTMTTSLSSHLAYDSSIHSEYVLACGNAIGPSRYLIAVQLKQLIQRIYLDDFCGMVQERLVIPQHSIVVVESTSHFPLQILDVQLNNSLVFSKGCYIPNTTKLDTDHHCDILNSFFLTRDVLFKVYERGTLYTVCKRNPFGEDLMRNRKDGAFHTLAATVRRLDSNSLPYIDKHSQILPLSLVQKFRFFKRNCPAGYPDIKHYSSWYFLARELFSFTFRSFSCSPCSTLARKIFQASKRLKLCEGTWNARPEQQQHHQRDHRLKNLIDGTKAIPRDFYTCEISLDEKNAVGVMGKTGERYDEIMYVSPMVVADYEEEFKDVNQKICNVWLPMYKNPVKFEKESFLKLFHCSRTSDHLRHMVNILEKDEYQKVDKFRYMLADLRIVQYILSGQL